MKNIQFRFNIILDIEKKKKKRLVNLKLSKEKHREKDSTKINRASVSYGTSSLSLCIYNWSILKDGRQGKQLSKLV